MGKKRKMMIGAVAVVVVIAVVVSSWFVLLRNKDETGCGSANGKIELSFSEMPTLNKTVNVTLTIKMREGYISDLRGTGFFLFFTNESNGFEWVGGKAEYVHEEFFTEDGDYVDEIDKPYFEYKNCSDVWGEKGKYAKMTGIIKVVKPGNWTIAGGVTDGGWGNPNLTSPEIWDDEYKYGKHCGWYAYTFITIHVDGNSSYILEEGRYSRISTIAMYYHYMHPDIIPGEEAHGGSTEGIPILIKDTATESNTEGAEEHVGKAVGISGEPVFIFVALEITAAISIIGMIMVLKMKRKR